MNARLPVLVYFMRRDSDGFIKIGSSFAPEQRRIEIERAVGCRVELLSFRHGGIEAERELHRQFLRNRADGEWFRPCAELLAIAKPSRRGIVARADGRELKRMTVYLPADLAKRLAIHCADIDSDVSRVISAAVEGMLTGGAA